MDTVQRFGRLGKFDFLTMLGKLGIAPIEPGITFLKGATGPLACRRSAQDALQREDADRHKQPPPSGTRTYEAHSTYTAGLGVPDRRRYRRTRPGAPTVADLVQPGDTVATSYSTGGVVIAVKEYFYAAPTGETLSYFTIVYVPPDRTAKVRDSDRHWINECVAVGDRILMQFEANTGRSFRRRPSPTGRNATVQDHTDHIFFFTSTTKGRPGRLINTFPDDDRSG